MADQLGMQREDYEYALKKGKLYLCKDCDALTISTCEDVVKGECFYCGSKNVSHDLEAIKNSLKKKIKKGVL